MGVLKWMFLSVFWNSEIFCLGEIYLLDPIEEMNDVSAEAYKEYEVLKSGILDEVVDSSPRNCHVFSLHGSFEYQFDSVQGNLQLGQPSHGKKMT